MGNLHIVEKLTTGEAIVTHSANGTDFGVRLPSGMIHWFRTETAARGCAYWPVR